jgi:hypothetical protein
MMISTKQPLNKQIFEQCYSTDTDFLNKYHRSAGKDFSICVDQTFGELVESNNKLSFYKVEEDGNLAGFFGIENKDNINYLSVFFIKPEYRNKKEQFWNTLSSNITSSFFICGIYKQNSRAIKFLQKLKGKEIFSNNDVVVFKMENKSWQ